MNQNIANNIVSAEEVKKMIVEALNIGHLPENDQDSIIGELAGTLMERATLALLKQLPAEEFDRIDVLVDAGQDAEIVEEIRKVVPNAQAIMQEAIHSGIAEYKVLVNEQVRQRLDKTTATTAK